MSSISRKMLMAAAGVDTDPTADYNKVSALYHFDGTNGLSNAGFAKDGGTYSGSFSISGGAPYQSEANPFSRPDGCWSVLFDGSDDYINIPDQTGLTPGTSDFTIECWVYFSSTTTNQGIFQLDTTPLSGTTYIGPVLFTGGGLYDGRWGTMTKYGGNQSLYADTQYNPKVNEWYHTAVVRTSNTVKVFVNGVQIISDFTDATDFSDRDSIVVGSMFSSSYDMTGYISGFRYVKGTAVYTSAFTPPTAPPTAVTNTELLLSFTNGQIIDSSQKAIPTITNDAQISTAQQKFGTASLLLDGANDKLTIDDIPPFGDFTVEFWMRRTVNFPSYGAILSSAGYYTTGYTNNWIMRTEGASSLGLAFYTNGQTGLTYKIWTVSTMSIDTWYHVAFCRSGSDIRAFLDGTESSSGTLSLSTSFTDHFTNGLIVGEGTLNTDYAGYIDDLRITNKARYTSSFTAPTKEFPNK